MPPFVLDHKLYSYFAQSVPARESITELQNESPSVWIHMASQLTIPTNHVMPLATLSALNAIKACCRLQIQLSIYSSRWFGEAEFG